MLKYLLPLLHQHLQKLLHLVEVVRLIAGKIKYLNVSNMYASLLLRHESGCKSFQYNKVTKTCNLGGELDYSISSDLMADGLVSAFHEIENSGELLCFEMLLC